MADHGPGCRTHGDRAEHRWGEHPDQDAGAATPSGTAPAQVVAGVHQPRLTFGVLADQDHPLAAQLLGRDPVGQSPELRLGEVDVRIADDDQHLGFTHGLLHPGNA
jgi:hypothetical protein